MMGARWVRVIVVYPDGEREVIAEERVESEAPGPMAWSQAMARLAPLLTQAMLEQGHKIARAARLVFEMTLAPVGAAGFPVCTEDMWVTCDAVSRAVREGRYSLTVEEAGDTAGFAQAYLEYRDGELNLCYQAPDGSGWECIDITGQARDHCPDAFLEEAPGIAVLP